MISQPANIELLTQQVAALAMDRQSMERQLQQLLKVLEVGQVVEARLDNRSTSAGERPVLIVQNVPLPITDEQVKQLDKAPDNVIKLRVQNVSEQRIELKVVQPPTRRSEQAVVTETVVDEVQTSNDNPQTRLLDVINKLNPDRVETRPEQQPVVGTKNPIQPATTQPGLIIAKSAQAQEQQVQTERPPQQSVPGQTITSDSVMKSGRINPDNQPVIPKQAATRTNQPAAEKPDTATGSRIESTTSSKARPSEQTAIPAQPGEQIKQETTIQQPTAEINQPKDSSVPVNTPINRESVTPSTQPLPYRQIQAVASESIQPSPGQEQKPENQPVTSAELSRPPKSGYDPVVVDNSTKSPREEPTGINTSGEPLPKNVLNSPNEKTANDATERRDVGVQTTSPAESQKVPPSPEQPYRNSELKLDISVPNPQQYPLLAQTVQQASSQLLASPNGMTDQLNKLLNQLQRLNDVQGNFKRELRSESGQVLNKATDDLKRGLKDLQRYIPQRDQLTDGPRLKKAIKQSGMFFEQKQQANQEQANNRSKPTIHHDFKANLQRLISASLYHLAKISVTYSTRPAGTTTAQTTGTTTTTQTNASTNPVLDKPLPKADLVARIKQRLHGFGNQAVSADLPRQVEQLLRQILRQSNESMNRTKLNQLGNLRPDNMPPQWFFELPIMNNQRVEPVQIFIKREDTNQLAAQEKAWSLVLQFNIQQLGRIRAILNWRQDRVDIQFIAEHEPTTELITKELDFIRGVVKAHDVSLDELSVRQQALKDISLQYSGAHS